MKSLNIKRVAAVVTGVAMVASVISPALAAVSVGSGADSLVASIKAAPADTTVIVGASAAISDGVSAAKIAAVLASMNYKLTEVTGTPVMSGSKSVTVTPSATATTTSVETPSASYYPAILTADDEEGEYSATLLAPVTLTPQTLAGVLSTGTVEATVGGDAKTYAFEEKIYLDAGVQALYSEDDDLNTHGMYLSTDGTDGLQYELSFTSPMSSNGSKYSETPMIKILGSEYSIDTDDLTDGELSLYSGQKLAMKVGEEQTVGAYTVKITAIGQVTSDITQLAVSVTVSDGTSTNSKTINAGEGYDFFGNKVSVYVESAMMNTGDANSAVVRLGSGKVTLEEDVAFPLDPAWTVYAIDITTGTDGEFGGFTLKYGNEDSSDKVIAGAFDGTEENGLAQGVSIMGPKNYDGASTFKVQLKGFGGRQMYYTTGLELKGVNDENDSVIQATWTDIDGLVNVFAPSEASKVNYDVDANGTEFNLIKTTMPYTIINDKVLYFTGVESQGTGDEKQYRAVFKVGGTSGFEIASTWTAAGFDIGTDHEWLDVEFESLDGFADIYSFEVDPVDTNEVVIDAADADFSMANIDMGSMLMEDQPELDLSMSLGENGTAFIEEAGSQNDLAARYMTSGDDDGFVVKEAYMDDFEDDSVVVINQAQSTVETSDKYAITGGSTVIDGSTSKKLVMTLADAAMDATVSISAVTVSTDTTTPVSADQQVLSEGGAIAGVVTVNSITCPTASTTVEGQYYTAVKAGFVPDQMFKVDQVGGTYQIVVGGPAVNQIAMQMTAASQIAQEGDQIIAAEGSKLLVAGFSATDTSIAADQLIALLKA